MQNSKKKKKLGTKFFSDRFSILLSVLFSGQRSNQHSILSPSLLSPFLGLILGFISMMLNPVVCLAATPSYEAWYDIITTMPGAAPQKGTLHTYYDGRFYYGKQTDSAGNVSAMKWEIPIDTTTTDYVKSIGAKPMPRKIIETKPCDGWSFQDQLMKRPTENWIDDTNHLLYQVILKYAGDAGKYEQKRTKFKLAPTSSDLTTDPDVIKSSQ